LSSSFVSQRALCLCLPLFPYTTLFRSHGCVTVVPELSEFAEDIGIIDLPGSRLVPPGHVGNVDQTHFPDVLFQFLDQVPFRNLRSEEHTSELQSRVALVCRPMHEKKTN